MMKPHEMKTSAILSANAQMSGPAALRSPARNMVNLGPTCSHNRLDIGPERSMHLLVQPAPKDFYQKKTGLLISGFLPVIAFLKHIQVIILQNVKEMLATFNQ